METKILEKSIKEEENEQKSFVGNEFLIKFSCQSKSHLSRSDGVYVTKAGRPMVLIIVV